MKKWLLSLCLLVFVCLLSNGAESGKRPPNIIFLLTDDMGLGDVGCYGGKMIPTPNIDRLASEGTRFTQYYVASPVCSPSRTGMLTGSYPARWRITNYLQTRAGNRASEQADFLDPKAPSIARTLKAAGYATAHIGKWHMGGGRDVTNAPPFSAYGFDEHASTYESPQPDPDITARNWIWSPDDKVKRWDRTSFFVDKTLDFLKRHPNQPCYVNLWPDDVHTPWVPKGSDPAESKDGGERETKFLAVMAEYDRQVGRLLDGLKEMGLEENTILVFSSDNGPLPTFNGKRTTGLRGSKISLYEGGIRLPLIIRWPGHVPAGQVDEKSLINAVDLFPSFCGIAQASLPKDVKFDGEDLSKIFLGKSAIHKQPMLWEYGRNSSFGYPKGRNRSPNVAVRDGNWKLLVNADGTQAELYDLKADAKEENNVAEQNPEVTRRLSALVLDWRHSLP
ncbi:sulfatase-like hydrolase/transferase [Pedosphaera parvula]|uniref:Sulfatase n=1 Tax=Pedosphaera parvula (strain Ellin514) TaxID=320771 RepID=B9XBD5_PEDPL|nr:sulfatase-like hydrolase/transferase [Pedosphaera parvula]EEF62820.1 sulfatase [Pedosphaera parvula Ellin514]